MQSAGLKMKKLRVSVITQNTKTRKIKNPENHESRKAKIQKNKNPEKQKLS